MVTRTDIQNKLNSIIGDQAAKSSLISEWLDEQGCPPEDREKILQDLVTYENY